MGATDAFFDVQIKTKKKPTKRLLKNQKKQLLISHKIL